MITRAAVLGATIAAMACGKPVPPRTDALTATSGAAGPSPASVPAFPTAPLPSRPYTLPELRETVLRNGVRLVVIERHDQPIATIRVLVSTSGATIAAEKPGLAGVATTLLTKGTQTRSARQIAGDLDRLGAIFNTSVTPDWLSVSATALAEDVPVLFNLLSDLFLRPAYPEQEIDAARTRAVSEVRAAMAGANALADRYFLRELYGEAHPYGAAPSAATIAAINSQDVRAFRQAYFVPKNALLLVAGDVDAAQVEVLARSHFGGWKGEVKPLVRLPEPTPNRAHRITLIHKPGAAQSSIRVGGLTVGPEHPDDSAIRVFVRLLCRAGAGRLSSALDRKGWTYGLGCTTSETPSTRHVAIAFPSRLEVTDSALALVLNVVRSMSDQPPSAEEVNAAIEAAAGSYPLARLRTLEDVGAEVARARMLDLPVEHVFRYPEMIRAVTQDDVNRVGRHYFRPERLQIVVVGDAAKLIDKLEKIAPVSLYDTAARPISRSRL